jgi:hypothetical protein
VRLLLLATEVMVPDETPIAQVVMKREDGRSILDVARHTAESAGTLDVSEERAQAIRAELERLGFTIAGGNLNTLSVSGSSDRFREVFGIEPLAGNSGVAAHATRIPPVLDDKVADVFVPPPPEFFP